MSDDACKQCTSLTVLYLALANILKSRQPPQPPVDSGECQYPQCASIAWTDAEREMYVQITKLKDVLQPCTCPPHEIWAHTTIPLRSAIPDSTPSTER